MKKLRVFCLGLFFAALVALPTGSALALSLDFVPSSTVVTTGQMLDVDIILSGLTAAGQIVSAFDLDVMYDSTLLMALPEGPFTFGLALGDPMWFEALTDYDISTPGVVDLAELSLLPDPVLAAMQGDSVLLATLSFQAIAQGVAEFAFNWDAFNDIKGWRNEVIYPTGEPVPEPATMLLFGTGLAGTALLRRKKRKTILE